MECENGTKPSAPASNREVDDNYKAIVAVLSNKLRVIRGACGLQWIVQKRDAKTWNSLAYCGSRDGLFRSLKDHLLKEHLLKDYRKPSRAALDATSTARGLLNRGHVSSFGVDPGAWAIIEALPLTFPKETAKPARSESPQPPNLMGVEDVPPGLHGRVGA